MTGTVCVRRRGRRWRVAGLCVWVVAALVGVVPAVPAAYPPVVEIHVVGDPTTKPHVLFREMALGIGDPADPVAIEASRQSILDLGLFREVHIRERPAPDGVILDILVREKRFLLPLPRVDSSSDGDYSYGAQLRWNNVLGLNHTFDLRAERGDYPDDRLREEEDSARIRYIAPLMWGGYGWSLEAEHIRRVAPTAGGTFDERIKRIEALITHDFRESRPRRGWVTATGLHWRTQEAGGPLAPPRDGRATALVLGADFTDVRFHVYSETGRHLSSRFEWAHASLASEYGFRQLDVRFVEYLALPTGAHHSVNLIAAGGWHDGGPRRVSAYGLGGSTMLRAYDLDYLEGESYGYLSTEYLRPLFGRDWLRLLVIAETGATGRSVAGPRSGGPYTSIGAGVRVRLTWFMDLEFELGVAYPLRGGDGVQVFAGAG